MSSEEKRPTYTEVPVPPQYQLAHHDDEISLIELWDTLVKRKLIIIGSFITVLLLSILYTFSITPVYESRAVLQVGQTVRGQTIEDPAILVQRLKEEYRVGDSSEGSRPMPRLRNIEQDRNIKNLIVFTAEGYSSEEAQAVLNNVIDKIKEEHTLKFDEEKEYTELRLTSLNEQFERLDARIISYEERISSLPDRDGALAALLVLEKAKLSEVRSTYERQVMDLELAMSDNNINPTTLLREPTLTISPVKPNNKLNVALGAVVGAMVGVFGAFAIEFISNARRERQSGKTMGA
ncbi:Wzz/FepE/Etk N-terminal domain-containing protein [Heliorestis acidaminivorans]|uniref:Wzz/FepE/Etk N-terminal domain-containing protein n=1 Tax=Heliorestis acidaminivorans TaxID=553427 RepID=UPI0014796172|nr:Wzz/FepE/Etk N-terminal domain-containing protein [Heliorestis acidaminivorans]